MKTLALVLILASGTADQSAMAPAVGSWTAQFEGRTFLELPG